MPLFVKERKKESARQQGNSDEKTNQLRASGSNETRNVVRFNVSSL